MTVPSSTKRPRHHRKRFPQQRAAAVIMSVVTTSAISAAPAGALTSSAPISTNKVTITAHDGKHIPALVVKQRNAPTAGQPLIVMPSSWFSNRDRYEAESTAFAQRGYTVISLTSRGWWGHDGELDVAGPDTILDISDIINWAQTNTDADTNNVGCIGVSYGGGMCMLAAARDSRIRAIHSIAGWADISESLYPNKTRSPQAATLLLTLGNVGGHPGKTYREVERAFFDDKLDPLALTFSPTRAPNRHINELNHNNPAILMTHGWLDGFFPPTQITTMFDQLTTPKKLHMELGDHGTLRMGTTNGSSGLPSRTSQHSYQWFNRYLLGKGTDSAVSPAIDIRTLNTNRPVTGMSWSGLATQHDVLQATKPVPQRESWGRPEGRLMDGVAESWSTTFDAGIDTVASSGTLFLSWFIQQNMHIPTKTHLGLIDRRYGHVFTSNPYLKGTTIAGTPHIDLKVTTSHSEASIFVYLFDVSPTGDASLITHQPYSLKDVPPGSTHNASIDLQSVAWDVPAGHRVSVVVDTMDPRYWSRSTVGSKVTIGCDAQHPMTVTLPLR